MKMRSVKQGDHDWTMFAVTAEWDGLTPAQAANASKDKWMYVCKSNETMIVYKVQFFHGTISWARANAHQEGSMMNYGISLRSQANEKFAISNFFIEAQGKPSMWDGAAELYAANRRDFSTHRNVQGEVWEFPRGIDVGSKIRFVLDWGGYNGDVATLSQDCDVNVLIQFEIKKRGFPKFFIRQK